MEIFKGRYEGEREPFITIGTFDGLHYGHRVIIERTRAKAKEVKKLSGVITFDPPPSLFFQKEFPFLLTPTAEKISLLEETGIDFVWILEFNEDLAKTSAINFLERIVREVSPKGIVVGDDFKFGKEREGNVRLLKATSERVGFQLIVAQGIKRSGILVKSTTIRERLLLGDIKTANLLLGRRYSLTGEIKKGSGRGKEIGFPTLNLELKDKNKLLPIDGVYAVEFFPNSLSVPHRGVMNIGTRPTFQEGKREIEVHLLGQKEVWEEIKEGRVEIIQRIRPEIKFSGIDDLRERIRLDIQQAERVFSRLPKEKHPGHRQLK